MKRQELIAHCRTTRQGTPDGDFRDPRVAADVLGMLLDIRLAELASSARPPGRHVVDSYGRLVATEPGEPAPDPKEDRMACALATLISRLEDQR